MGDPGPDADLNACLRARDLARYATAAVERHGAELFGFLIHLMGSEADAAEVFSQTVEDLWRSLPSFAGHCSARTWLYLLARNAAARYRRSPWHRGDRTGDEALDEVVARARSKTAPWQRTDVRDRFRELRAALDPDDRVLLVLRIDRDLPWDEVARVMLGSEDPTAKELEREAVRLRKRFQLLKAELRRCARAAGLLKEPQ